jgi:predicted MPP superfamily phosphohydrolase
MSRLFQTMALTNLVMGFLAYLVMSALWPPLRRGRPRQLVLAAAVVCIGGWLLLRGPSGAAATVARALISTWFVTCLMCFLGGTAVLLLRTMARPFWRARPHDPERRQLLAGLALPAMAASTSAGGTLAGLSGFVVRREQVVIDGLPAGLEGLRIGQLTDVHVGEFVGVEHLQRAVDALDAEKVDLQVMTGDLIDDLQQLDATLAALERCRAPLGMVSILGNHEKIRGRLPAILDGYQRCRQRGVVRLLVDADLVLEHRGAHLRVVGVDYPSGASGGPALRRGERLRRMKESAARAFAGLPAPAGNGAGGETLVCLSHHPEFFPLAAARGAQLTLAGHTHGGQVAFFGRPLFGAFEYMLGRYRKGAAHLYVSGGTGHWLPFRVGVPPEVTVLTLTRGQPAAAAAASTG